jgi:hypothetical protein
MSSKDVIEILDNREAALEKRVLLSSGIALLLAAASRLPSWEVASPVGWLVGTVNVGFLPIFGPVLVLGTFAFTYLALREYLELRAAALGPIRGQEASEPGDALLRAAFPEVRGARNPVDRALWTALVVQRLWIFAVPLAAYGILFASYLDFVRPTCDDASNDACLVWAYPHRSGQVMDLVLGTGGWGGFKPVTPSILSALKGRAAAAGAEAAAMERHRLVQVAHYIPWIYPPIQTWAYFVGLLVQGWLSLRGWREFGTLQRVRLRRS